MPFSLIHFNCFLKLSTSASHSKNIAVNRLTQKLSTMAPSLNGVLSPGQGDTSKSKIALVGIVIGLVSPAFLIVVVVKKTQG